MNEQQASKRGLVYTGISIWDKEALKERLEKEFRGKGYKAYLVTTPPNPLSRGNHGPIYSIYAEPRYSADKEAEKVIQRIALHSGRLEYLKQQYEEAVSKENFNNDADLEWLKNYREEYYPNKPLLTFF